MVSGGTAPYTWSVTGGQLPTGIGLSANGTVAGTCNVATVSNFTVQVVDSSSGPMTFSMSFALTITPDITTTTLPGSSVNEQYPSTTVLASGLSGSPTWSALYLPPGMLINAAGVLSGTPTSSGNFTPAFTVADPSGASATANIPLTINAAPTITDASPLPSGDAVVPYSYQFGSSQSPVSGGTPPYTWSTPSTLPTGLALNSTGLLSGTPTQTGLFTFSILVTDSESATGSKTFALLIGTLPVHVTEIRIPPASTIGVPYPPPPAAGVQPPYFQAAQGTGSYSWTSSGLPAGLAVSPTSGKLTGLAGTPAASGTFSASVTATDPANESETLNFNITINPAPAINSSPLLACTAGSNCVRPLSVSGGTAPFTWTISSGALPAGMSINSSGVIGGTPSAVASPTSSTFSVTATDVATASSTQQFTLLVNPAIVISPSSLPATTSGLAYSQTLTTTGGTGSITLASPNLPSWLSLTSGSLLSGTAPSVPSQTSFNFSVTASDASNGSTTNAYTVVVNPLPTISNPSPLPSWTINRPYSRTITATGGTGALTFSDAGSTLPSWLTITNAGLLSGTPPATGTVNFTLKVTDTLSASSSKAFALTINPMPAVTTTLLPSTTSGIVYGQTLAESGGTPTFSWSAAGLPGWLNLTTAGVLSGTAPAESGVTPFNFSVTVTDMAGAASAPQILTVTVNPAVQITTASPLPPADAGLGYSQTLSASGGTGAITWSSGNLPSWLSLSMNTGALTGTGPSVASPTQYNFSVTATDTVNAPASKPFSVTVNPLVTIVTASPLPPWTINQLYSQTITATNGTPGYTFADAGATLPAWLSISPGGALTGTPPATGTFNFTLKVTDSLGGSNTKPFALTINPTPAITTTSLPATTSGLTYSQTLAESGGTPGFTYTAGGLPSWLVLTGATLSGTAPTVSAATPFNFSVTVTDSTGATSASQALSVTVNPGVTITTPNPLPTARSGTAYSQTFTAAGGTGAITWTFGNLPNWLTANGATISGTAPTVAQATQYNFTASAKDSLGATSGNQAYNVTVSPGVVIVTSAALGPWTIGSPFTATLSASGGTPPYTFSDAGQTLPAWLSLTGNVLRGTPTATGSFQFTIKAVDSLSSSGTKTFTLPINPVPTLTTLSAPATSSGQQYSAALGVSGGTPPYTWNASNLPSWLSLNMAAIVGTAPTVNTATQYSFNVSVTDSTGAISGAMPLTVTVNPPVTITTTSPLPPATPGLPYSVTFAGTGGTGSLTWSTTGLPTWLTLNGATLSGTPPAGAAGTTLNITMRATDTVGAYAFGSFQLPIGNGGQSNNGTLPSWTVNRPYSTTLTATGGTAPYKNWTVTGGALPAGLQLTAGTGLLAGTPTVAGTNSFTTSTTDSNNQTFLTAWSLTINPAPAISTQSLPPGSPGTSYTQNLSATGGTAPLTWGATGLNGSGLTLLSSGVLTGVPIGTTSATVNFTATVTDAAGATAQAQFSVTIGPAISITTAALPATTSTASYSATITASGGTGAITFSAVPGSLPNWLALSANGKLTGTAPGESFSTDFDFIVIARDSIGVTASKPLTVTVNPAPRVVTTVLPIGTVSALYFAELSAGGGTGALTWSAQNLPSWASLNSSTGAISGTPPAAATVTISAVATDSVGVGSQPASLKLEIDQTGGTPQISTACPLAIATAGLPINLSATANGGFPPYTWSATGLPVWLTLSSNGTFSGTSVAGASAFSLQVSDSKGQTATVGCGITVNAGPTINQSSLAPGTIGAPYAQTLSAFGGTGALVWSSANLPSWLSIEPQSGVLGGTPMISGNYNFTVLVTDSLGVASAPASFTIQVTTAGGVPILTSCPLPQDSVGRGLNFQLTAALGFPPYQWSVSKLPAGLSANSAGIVTGTPSAAGPSQMGLTVTDSANVSISGACTMNIFVTPAVTTANLPNGTVGAYYWQELTASGGIGALRWSISGAPAWMSLDPNSGILSGTPAAVGPVQITVTVTDSQNTQSPPASLSFNVTEQGGPVVITTACPLQPITQSVLLDQVFTATGGAPPYSWAASGLPLGISLSSSGAMIGAPNSGTISFTVRATDQQQKLSPQLSCSLQVNAPPAITTAQLPNGIAGTPYAATINAAGGTGELTWSAAQPYWLVIDSLTGNLTGTPPAAAQVSTIVHVADGYGVSNSKTFSFTVAPPSGSTLPALVTACPLPGATAGAGYSETLMAAGGTSPYQFFISGLPTGLTSGNSGAISGTPASAGSVQLVIEVIDANRKTATLSCGLTVAAGSAFSIVVSAPDGKVNQPYTGGFSANGGVAPIAWSVSSGSLPPGIVLDPSSGLLSGTPTTLGSYTFNIKAADSSGAIATAAVSINIASALTITTPPALPDASGGTAYKQTLIVSGATGTVAWSLVSGTLPPGLSLDPVAGVISGSATQGGTFTFTVLAVDSSKTQAQVKFTLKVDLAAIPQVTITGVTASLTPNQQPTPVVTLASPYPLDITGQLNLTLTADPTIGLTDPTVQFSSGGQSVPFRIPANSTQAIFTPSSSFQTGTLASTFKLDVTLQTGGSTVQPPASAAVTTQVPKTAPVIVGTPAVVRTTNGLQVTLIAFSTSREIISGTFQFTGTNVSTTSLLVSLSGVVGPWYSSAASDGFGSMFKLIQPFTTQGSPSQVTGMTITLTNSVGTSMPVTVSF